MRVSQVSPDRICHLSFSDNIRRNVDQGQLTGAVLIHLLKAFDTVDPAVLLDKLSNLGIEDIERCWFTDYMSNRTQVVEFQGVTSNPGRNYLCWSTSRFYPRTTMFILHINYLPEVVSKCNILMYVDGTGLYCSTSQASVIQGKPNAELSKIEHWFLLINE